MNLCQYTKIKEITRLTDDGTILLLQYYLTCRQTDAASPALYGICIRKYTQGQKLPEEASTPPISYSQDFVRQLLQHLIQNAVTPMCLLEVLDELLCLC